MNKYLEAAFDKLNKEFHELDWTYHDIPGSSDKMFNWLGRPDEDIKICVLKANDIDENFHKHDFFFFNFAYKNDYQALSSKYDNLITIKENECYIGQPHSGYALKTVNNEDIIIIGVLIKKETFFREYLPILSTNNAMFHFFLEPQTNKFSDEFIRLSFQKCSPIRLLLEMMVAEYANEKEDTQSLLKPMVLTLLMLVSRQYKAEHKQLESCSLCDKIVAYINEHTDNITLNEIAKHFSYHPNYISSLLHKETGKKFSQIVLEKRMNKATVLLKNTTLSVEEISTMLGYSDTSNFYKAFREYYSKSPREFINED